jgi:hypothetical protein
MDWQEKLIKYFWEAKKLNVRPLDIKVTVDGNEIIVVRRDFGKALVLVPQNTVDRLSGARGLERTILERETFAFV